MFPSFFFKKGGFLANETTRFLSRKLTKLTFFYFGHPVFPYSLVLKNIEKPVLPRKPSTRDWALQFGSNNFFENELLFIVMTDTQCFKIMPYALNFTIRPSSLIFVNIWFIELSSDSTFIELVQTGKNICALYFTKNLATFR